MPADDPKTKTPVLYVFFGMIATGKSTLAEEWARYKKLEAYNSDRLRKELAGISPEKRGRQAVDAGIYSREFSRKTYGALRARAERALKRGSSVVLDASYQYGRDRRELRDLAASLLCRICFVLCQCPEAEMKRRMQIREQDPAAISDGRWEIYLEQKKRFEAPTELGPHELVIIDTSPSLEVLLGQLAAKLP